MEPLLQVVQRLHYRSLSHLVLGAEYLIQDEEVDVVARTVGQDAGDRQAQAEVGEVALSAGESGQGVLLPAVIDLDVVIVVQLDAAVLGVGHGDEQVRCDLRQRGGDALHDVLLEVPHDPGQHRELLHPHGAAIHAPLHVLDLGYGLVLVVQPLLRVLYSHDLHRHLVVAALSGLQDSLIRRLGLLQVPLGVADRHQVILEYLDLVGAKNDAGVQLIQSGLQLRQPRRLAGQRLEPVRRGPQAGKALFDRLVRGLVELVGAQCG